MQARHTLLGGLPDFYMAEIVVLNTVLSGCYTLIFGPGRPGWEAECGKECLLLFMISEYGLKRDNNARSVTLPPDPRFCSAHCLPPLPAHKNTPLFSPTSKSRLLSNRFTWMQNKRLTRRLDSRPLSRTAHEKCTVCFSSRGPQALNYGAGISLIF